jgi:hypothetical protein
MYCESDFSRTRGTIRLIGSGSGLVITIVGGLAIGSVEGPSRMAVMKSHCIPSSVRIAVTTFIVSIYSEVVIGKSSSKSDEWSAGNLDMSMNSTAVTGLHA